MKKSIFLLAILLIVNGCAVALVGAGGVGGYAIAKDKRTVGTISNDAWITSAINAKYARDNLVSALDINVDTYEGNVTLTGSVNSSNAKSRAVSLARSVKGVKNVTSKLVIIN